MKTLEHWVDRHLKWVLIAPSILLVAALILYPLAFTLNLWFTDAKRATSRPYDYVRDSRTHQTLTNTERFWPAVGRTAHFTAGALVVEMILGIAIALVLRKSFRGEEFVRVAILLPLVATPVAVGMMWLPSSSSRTSGSPTGSWCARPASTGWL